MSIEAGMCYQSEVRSAECWLMRAICGHISDLCVISCQHLQLSFYAGQAYGTDHLC